MPFYAPVPLGPDGTPKEPAQKSAHSYATSYTSSCKIDIHLDANGVAVDFRNGAGDSMDMYDLLPMQVRDKMSEEDLRRAFIFVIAKGLSAMRDAGKAVQDAVQAGSTEYSAFHTGRRIVASNGQRFKAQLDDEIASEHPEYRREAPDREPDSNFIRNAYGPHGMPIGVHGSMSRHGPYGDGDDWSGY